MQSAAAVSRRSVLGLAALALAACKHGSSPSAPRVDPDAAALDAARDSEYSLLNAATDPAERSAHSAHYLALGGTPGTLLPSSAPTNQRRPLLRSADSLRGAAVAAVDGAHAALFASIAASHEVMAHE